MMPIGTPTTRQKSISGNRAADCKDLTCKPSGANQCFVNTVHVNFMSWPSNLEWPARHGVQSRKSSTNSKLSGATGALKSAAAVAGYNATRPPLCIHLAYTGVFVVGLLYSYAQTSERAREL